MTAAVTPFARLFALNTDLLLNATDDVTDDEAVRRVLPRTNTIAFLVAHLTDMRHYLASVAGHPTVNPLAPLLERAKSEDDVVAWPPLEMLRGQWTAVGGHLAALLPSLGGIAFAVEHESYHLGQIAMLRRGLGHPAMSYRRRS